MKPADRDHVRMLTVREIVGGLPAGTQIMAGSAGLDREVTWAVGLRTRQPIFPVLKGGEFALVAISTLKQLDPPVLPEDAISRLGDRGVTAIGVVGPIAKSAIDEAERRGLPLLALPADTVLAELESGLVRLIGEARTALYQWGIEVEHRLAEVSIGGGGLARMVSLLAELLGVPAIWQDGLGRPVAIGVPTTAGLSRGEVEQSLVIAGGSGPLRPPSNGTVARLPCPLPDWVRWGVRVVVARSTVGYLSLLVPTGQSGTRERLALERAALAFAQEAAKERAVQAAETRLRGDYLNALLTAPASELAEVQIRSRQFGLDLTRALQALVFQVQADPAAADGGDEALELLANRLDQFAIGLGQPLVRVDDDCLVALMPAAVAGKQVAEEVAAVVRQAVGAVVVSAGVGRAYAGAEGVRTSFHEARTALEISTGLDGPGQVTAFEDLGAYRLLYALRGHPDLSAIFEETLGPLRQYDAENGTELLRTLELYFACDGVLSRAAEQLYLHRNSLAYRLRRIEEITGLSLESAEARFRLQLALKIWRLLRQAVGRQRER